jgi:hypothetical protein
MAVFSVNFYQTTRRYNPEDSHLRTRIRENHKSYIDLSLFRLLKLSSFSQVFLVFPLESTYRILLGNNFSQFVPHVEHICSLKSPL